MAEEDFARYIPLLEDMNATLRMVADGQRSLIETCVGITACYDRMSARIAQLTDECEARDAKRRARTPGPAE